MRLLRASAVAVSILGLILSSPTVKADDKAPGRITVSFGTGNNNAAPGNTPNHHIIPQEFKVSITKAKKLDGTVVMVPATVNFVVAGFHWPWVYKPGTTVQEVQANIPPGNPLFINYDVNVFAKGIDPTAGTALPLSSAQNRVESFAFSTPGRYLVICNVRPHFLDGMFAWINVVMDDDN